MLVFLLGSVCSGVVVGVLAWIKLRAMGRDLAELRRIAKSYQDPGMAEFDLVITQEHRDERGVCISSGVAERTHGAL